MRAFLGDLLDLLLPPACGRCRAPVPRAAALCARCDAALSRLPASACRRCGEAPARLHSRWLRCAPCEGRESALLACVASVAFEGEIERWIHRFKYPSPGPAGLDPAPGAVLAALIREAARRAPGAEPALVVPVPLHPRRLRERGFNPAAQLARALAREHGIRCAPAALERIRDTPSQTGLSRRARRRNVAGAFRARSARRLPARIWLVDDVVTTGSTLEEAARALRRAGAREVVGICVARTPRRSAAPFSSPSTRRPRGSRGAAARDRPAS
ncbi:MAG: ComF family protein [Deltaproteobacteria bacterium]|nr:MAG: ComF family protein [Deltaproteobacteria bacterium]